MTRSLDFSFDACAYIYNYDILIKELHKKINAVAKTTVQLLLVNSLFFLGFVNAAASPNNPILVVATDDKFGYYTCEILKTEGPGRLL